MDEVFQNETRFPGGEWKAASEPFTDVVRKAQTLAVTHKHERRHEVDFIFFFLLILEFIKCLVAQNGEKSRNPREFDCPPGWAWEDEWTVDDNRAVDDQGAVMNPLSRNGKL